MRLGKDKHAVILVFSLFIFMLAGAQPGKSHKYQLNGDLQKSSVLTGRDYITIYYSLPELNVETLTHATESFYRISVPGHMVTVDPGKPELPVSTNLITIPDGQTFRIIITDVKSERITPSKKGLNGLLYPAQEGETKQTKRGSSEFRIDKKLYSMKSLIKSDTVSIEYIGKVRGKQLANLLINPVRYNPGSNSLEVIKSMRINVEFTGDEIKQSGTAKGESALFNDALSKAVLNYNPEDVITGYSDQPVEMIILTDTTFKKHLEPLFRWKTQKGYKLRILYRGKGLAGDTFTEIKQTLSGIYKESSGTGPGPEYLLIIGDVDKIPFYGSGYITDMYYGEFDGNGDYIPEMFIGRIPANDTNAVKSAVSKIIQYETFQVADTNTFYSRALVATGKDEGYANHMNGQVKYAITNYLNPTNKISNFHFYYPDGYTKKDSIMKLIKSGLSFINYTGHGSSAGWLHLDIKSPDIAKFGNNNMYPFIISNACRTAQFSDTASFGNKMLNASGKGAIGFIGCSNDSFWDEDFYWIIGTGTPSSDPKYSSTGLGAYDRLFHTHNESPSDWFITMGQVNYAGNLSVSSSTSQKKKYYWETYTLLGDPSIIPILGKPEPFKIVLPDTLPNGIRSLSVTIDPYAYMAVSHFDTLWDASFASPSGSVVLDLPEVSEDSCLVVITGQNRIPLIKTIYFSSIKKEFVNLSGAIINDASGNNNGRADFGETLYLDLKISNLGQTDATNLRATISSTSSWVTINNNSVLIGTLQGLQEVTIANQFGITIARNVPDLGIITINLLLKDSRAEKNYKIDVTIHAPRLEVLNCILDDSKSGNNNFIADPGETFSLVFHVRNYGSSNTSGQFSISTGEENLTILSPSVKSGLLQFGEVTEISVLVKLSESSLFGEFISLSSTLDCTPYLVNKNFAFRVGRIRESFESSSFRVFPWINISSKPWTITQSNSFDGNLSARSGAITHNGSSVLKIRTQFSKADSIKFYYKVSSELNYDYMEFRLNDTSLLKKSGEVDWERKAIKVRAGVNKLEWIYKKDNSVSQGSDGAWLDLIDFSVSNPISYIQRDLGVSKIESPVKKDIYGKEQVSVKVYNIGRDTLNGFFLAYTINDGLPVKQFFNERLFPYKDTLTVTFDKKADLDQSGIYNIAIFGIDNDDDFLLNDTLSITLENKIIEESINIYPNPFSDRLTIEMNSQTHRKARISLTNISGKRVIDLDREIITGENLIIINTQHLSPSLYILRINAGITEKVYPLIKVKE